MTSIEARAVAYNSLQAVETARTKCLSAIEIWWKAFSEENNLQGKVADTRDREGELIWNNGVICFRRSVRGKSYTTVVWSANDYIDSRRRDTVPDLGATGRYILQSYMPVKE